MAKKPPKEPKDPRRFATLQRVLDRFEGARLCYGEPVRVGDRAVVPIARVRVAGGVGFGRGDRDEGEGGGGGGWLEANPVGFLDCGPEGTRFEPIPDPDAAARRLRAGAGALATVLTAVAGVRALKGRGEGRRLLRR
jgi:uncharacterized spore protein YtfJ